MTLEEQIMKLQTYKMFEGEDTVYVDRDDVLKLLEQEPVYYPPCIDCHKKMDEIRCAYDKLKEQESCEDAVSPTAEPVGFEEAKKLIYQEWKCKVAKDNSNQRLLVAYQIAIKALEQTRWIPVSDRLPVLRGMSKISDDVLITNGFENDMGYLVERKGKIFWHYYGGEYEFGIKDEDNDAIAWMPLPEPYKAESDCEE